MPFLFIFATLFSRYTKRMKNRKLLNLTLLSLVLFFSACVKRPESLHATNASESLSVYNAINMNESRENRNNNSSNSDISDENAVQDIEYISYRTSDSTVNRQQTVKEIEFHAKRFLGTPYVWGATGPDTFDCSGFTQWVFRDVGINIPRVSKDQARVGQLIAFDELKAGDMIFFDTHKKRTGKVTHVGIYLGDGNFIHASSAGKKVVIYNFNKKSYYKKRFLWGRRVTNHGVHYASN